MPRLILSERQLHPAIRERIARLHADVLDEVVAAMAQSPVLVVGMTGNPFVGRARRALARAGVAHHYLGYGGYLSQWRRRNALKMWTGWPTFPMVFVRGQLVGGATDLEALIARGELASLLAAPAPDLG
jgi:monothiol glutaredoxin